MAACGLHPFCAHEPFRRVLCVWRQLPFLFRGRSDAVLNTLPTREKCAAAGREVHLAEMETTTIKELPAFDSARAILRNWRRNFK